MTKRETIAEILEHALAEHATRDAFGYVGNSAYSYAEIGTMTARLRGLLAELGVETGDRVALWSENAPLWPVVYLGVTSFPGVIVPILPDFSAEDVGTILEHSGAKVLFVSARLKARLAAASISGVTVVEMDSLAERLAPAPERAVGSPGGEDLAAIIYTSGTTGHSKGVMLSHRNICANVYSASLIPEIRPGQRMLSVLPLSHTYECTLGFLLPFAEGVSVWYFDRPASPTVFLEGMRKIKPNLMLSVPLLIEKVVRNKVLAEINGKALLRTLSKAPVLGSVIMKAAGKKLMNAFGGNLHFFGVGGAPLAADVEQALRRMKFPYSVGYGLTETAPLLAGGNPKYTKFRSTGPAVADVELRIKDGEIQARGPNVMSGYYKNPELTAEVFTEDGWFKTGDLGEIHEDGYVYVKGRSKSMILGASGENIYPEAIEAVINGFKGVSESLVIQRGKSLVARVRVDYEALAAAMGKVGEAAGNAAKDAADAARGAASSAAGAARGAADAARGAAHSAREAAGLRAEEIKHYLDDLRTRVNARLSAFSRIGSIEEEHEPFAKTPTMKIKRYLYEDKSGSEERK